MVLPPRELLYNNVMSRQGCMRYVGYGNNKLNFLAAPAAGEIQAQPNLAR